MRYFNTSGPVVASDHYCVPPLDRVNLAEIQGLIAQNRYFVLHAPRQTGKTSALLALQGLLNAEGRYCCVYVNVEAGQPAREDVTRVVGTVLAELASRAYDAVGDESLEEIWPGILEKRGPDSALREALTRWTRAVAQPLVLLIDEIDALVGDSLLSILRQLRAGYDLRPGGFPQSVVLCGVRDVRDYRIHSRSANTVIAGGSAFNIKAESLRLGDFSKNEVRALLRQHAEETGQPFADDAMEAVWTQTRGQPWLVNALAYQTCFRGAPAKDRSRPIAEADVLDAREALVLRRDTHLDQLTDKLQEDRVRRVVEPLLTGAPERRFALRDVEYVRDLGLIAQDRPVRMANPIYAEVVPRELSLLPQEEMADEITWYVDDSGNLRMDKLLAAFQQFFRKHSEHWAGRFQYQEAGPQLLLQAFLQRVVNSGGRIEREYGLGRGRTDLLVTWPEGRAESDSEAAPAGRTQKFVIECKVLHASLERTIADGVEQTAGYMDRCGAEAGHLVVFDRREGRSWEEKIFRQSRSAESGAEIEVWGM